MKRKASSSMGRLRCWRAAAHPRETGGGHDHHVAALGLRRNRRCRPQLRRQLLSPHNVISRVYSAVAIPISGGVCCSVTHSPNVIIF
jgi:hypothetical protein